MADAFYTSYEDDVLIANVALLSATIKIALVTSTYTFSAAHEFFDEITNEVSGPGYTAGGETLGSKTVATGTFDSANAQWTSATFTARRAIMYKDTGVDTTSPLIKMFDFLGDISPSNGTLTLAFNASGIIDISS